MLKNIPATPKSLLEVYYRGAKITPACMPFKNPACVS